MSRTPGGHVGGSVAGTMPTRGAPFSVQGIHERRFDRDAGHFRQPTHEDAGRTAPRLLAGQREHLRGAADPRRDELRRGARKIAQGAARIESARSPPSGEARAEALEERAPLG